MKRKLVRWLVAMLAILAMTAGVLVVTVPAASAESCNASDFAPDVGAVMATGPENGSNYTAAFQFKLTEAQVNNLRCMDPFLEIDFHLYNFGLGKNWEAYRVYSNIPGYMHDTAEDDNSLTEQIPAATGIWTSSLEKDKTYYVMITWSAPNAQVGATKVGIGWTPSYWPNPIDHPLEFGLCTLHQADMRWCLFGDQEEGHTYDLTKGKFKNAYPSEGHLPTTNTYTWRSFGGWNVPPITTAGGLSALMSAIPVTSNSAPLLPPGDPFRPAALQYGATELSVFQRDADNHVKKDSWNGSGWSGFGDMGGDMLGNPASVQYGNPAELDVFSRSSGNEIRKNTWNGSSWSGWNSLGGDMRGSPSAVAYGSELDVFARGSNNEIWKDTWNGSSWSGWNSLGGNMSGNPTAVKHGNELDVFAKATDNGALMKNTWNGGSWSGWNSLGGVVAGEISAVSYGSELDVFVRGTNGEVWKQTWNGSSWSGWNSLGGTLAGDPSAVVFGSELDVFMRSSVDGYVWKQTWNGSSWSGWNALGGTFAGNPVGVAYGSEMDVFVRGTNGRIYKDTWNGSSWSGFNDLGGNMVGDPAATQWNTELSVFARASGDRKIYKNTWNGSGWSGWNYLG